MHLPSSTDVLLVGAGPSGLALALQLARAGVPHVIIDRQPAGENASRACVVHAGTLEALEPLGLVPELLARGIQVPIFRVRDRGRALLTIDFRNLPSRYPYTLMLPQSDTEAVLLVGLEAHGETVLRSCDPKAVRRDTEGATVAVRDAEGERILQARYVIGCDGMHSVVREQAGIPFEGGSYQEAFVLADVHMEWPLSREEVTPFYSPAGLMVVAPIPEERYRVVATVRKAPAVPTIADVQALLDTRGPAIAPGRVRDIVWSSRFHIHHRLAQTFHDRCVLVVGDAAHVHSPAGGQGMNTGIQDAISLGNAMASAFGAGSAQSLVNWAHDRRRVARRVVRLTDRMTRAATIGNKTGQIVRNTIVELAGHVPAIRRAIAMRLSELSERAA